MLMVKILFFMILGGVSVAHGASLECEANPQMYESHSNYGLITFDEIEGACTDIHTKEKFHVFLGGSGFSLRSESFFEFSLDCTFEPSKVYGGYEGMRFHIGLPGASAGYGRFVSTIDDRNVCQFWGSGGDFGGAITVGVLILSEEGS